MQKIALLAFCLFYTSLISLAGEAPAAVQKSFTEKFPKAEKVKWVKEKDGNYEGAFILGGTEMSATFNAEGKWLETETTIAIKELPKPVSEYVTKNHPKAKITEAAKIQRISTDAILFEAEIKDSGKETDLLLTGDGRLVK
jgi:hypothetical protein